TCNPAIVVPTVPSVPGFTAQYSFNNGSTWGTSATSSTTGLLHHQTRYVRCNMRYYYSRHYSTRKHVPKVLSSNAVIFLRLL
ncbi:MAG: hypothetical protein IPN89_10880, partial [Saprospiraceae bacterium]|nr:hypothetical protein [Saprospiraceae bacterium]